MTKLNATSPSIFSQGYIQVLASAPITGAPVNRTLAHRLAGRADVADESQRHFCR